MHIKTVILLGIFFSFGLRDVVNLSTTFFIQRFFTFFIFFIKARFLTFFYSLGQRFFTSMPRSPLSLRKQGSSRWLARERCGEVSNVYYLVFSEPAAVLGIIVFCDRFYVGGQRGRACM